MRAPYFRPIGPGVSGAPYFRPIGNGLADATSDTAWYDLIGKLRIISDGLTISAVNMADAFNYAQAMDSTMYPDGSAFPYTDQWSGMDAQLADQISSFNSIVSKINTLSSFFPDGAIATAGLGLSPLDFTGVGLSINAVQIAMQQWKSLVAAVNSYYTTLVGSPAPNGQGVIQQVAQISATAAQTYLSSATKYLIIGGISYILLTKIGKKKGVL